MCESWSFASRQAAKWVHLRKLSGQPHITQLTCVVRNSASCYRLVARQQHVLRSAHSTLRSFFLHKRDLHVVGSHACQEKEKKKKQKKKKQDGTCFGRTQMLLVW